jgi:serine/threonine-protein kinase RsbW
VTIARKKRSPSAEAALESLELTLPSTLESVAQIEHAAEEFARRTGFDEDTASNVAMVVREAAVNAAKHGNRFVEGTEVRATLERKARSLTVRIADAGNGLDPAALPDPLHPDRLLKTSGRGVFLMRALMDEVDFRQLEPGTEVILTKHRNTEASS